ncbi:hypothetical protein R1sor_008490 [Riccia sorocarpa]|uniref:Uncharacterized protein n=1 Tax=Riccia sorocarpa TaxID=122646 RepID=A0ABD3HVQ8_9MARC
MKKIFNDFQAAHAVAVVEAASYGARASDVCEEETSEGYVEPCELWKDTLSSMKTKKTPREVILRTASTIREATGWNDPVATSSVHVYIAKSHHEALVEEKRRREDAGEGTSTKRQTRLEKSRQEPLPSNIVMDEVQKQADKGKSSMKEKAKGPSYKLQSDIEASTDLKAIFEEQILNSKNTKREKHVRFVDEIVDDGVVNPSHFSRNHWARATGEALVKLENLEEPVVALIDHGSEINLISKSVYEKGKWPIDTNHNWMIRGANSSFGKLFGACLGLKVKIGDVVVE